MSKQKLLNIGISWALKCNTKKLGQRYLRDLYRCAFEIYVVSTFFATRLYPINSSIMRYGRYWTSHICGDVFNIFNFILVQPDVFPNLLPQKNLVEPLRSCRNNNRVFDYLNITHKLKHALFHDFCTFSRINKTGPELPGARI